MGDHERELSEFWGGYEAAVGFKSTFSAMLAAHSGVALGSGSRNDWDPYAEDLSRPFQRPPRRSLIEDGNATYRALRRMQTADVVVLYQLFGPRNPRMHHDALGDLSPLAAMTDAVEDARCDVVLDESTRRSDATGARTKAEVGRQRTQLAADFWREVGAIARAASRYERARKPERLAAHEQRVTAGWTLLGQILDLYAVDGTIRARVGAIESTDREVTAEAAIRFRLRPTKDAGGAARQREFVAEVTREAEAMRATAIAAYRAARAEERLAAKASSKARQERIEAEDQGIHAGAA